MDQQQPVIVWFRNDLRLTDNPALHTAAGLNAPLIALYIWAPHEEGAWQPGGASKWWLHRSLESLDASLRVAGNRLILRMGSALEVLQSLARQTGASAVFWNRRYEPAARKRDEQIKVALTEGKIKAESFNGSLLREPWNIKNKQGKPYLVYTPFSRTYFTVHEEENLLTPPIKIRAPEQFPASEPLASLELLPRIPWHVTMQQTWEPGEDAAFKRLGEFVRGEVTDYDTNRNIPGTPGTSRLSPHLHFGEISPRQIWNEIQRSKAAGSTGAQIYLKEILWREFGYHLLFHFPATPDTALREQFQKFPWKQNNERFRAWSLGATGYPIVDAGMRQLWQTGWMHNRVRMIAASFLVKHLLISWQQGAAWFWDTLVDADLANNTLGWQWTAGCGADAAPYFRIFNPTLQGEKFDPEGNFVRKFVPELSGVPKRWIHRPWEAPQEVLAGAGVSLGNTYPAPIVDHREAREDALEAFDGLSGCRPQLVDSLLIRLDKVSKAYGALPRALT